MTEASAAVDAVVARAEELYHDIDLDEVRRWRERTGGRAVGYMPIYVPRELIDAAGMLPVGLMGGGDQIEIIRGDAYFQSYICAIPRSTIELALTGRYDVLDGFLFPSICDVIRNLSGMWQLLFPGKYVRYFDVPQNYAEGVGGAFYRRELTELRDDMAALAGRPVTDDDVRASIARYNDNRRLVRELHALRRAQPWRVPTYEAYLVLRAGTRLDVDAHTAMLRAYLDAVRTADRPMRDNSRVVLVGAFCEQPPLGLIKTLEMAGCYIVWDDLTLGLRWLEQDVTTEGDPIAALADAFLHHSVHTASRYAPGEPKGQYLVDAVRDTGAEGVIFAAPSFCDPSLLEQPMLQAALDRAGIPWTAFKYSENLGQFQVIREQAGTFADSIKLWSDA
ncbi:MAG: benzoyl-CoA reductase subunit C [Deltaproteobacteria bacterium]|nr:MAG: benzoyl-CoA reductase subunit C [Deltaproteobacteria bacterium]